MCEALLFFVGADQKLRKVYDSSSEQFYYMR